MGKIKKRRHTPKNCHLRRKHNTKIHLKKKNNFGSFCKMSEKKCSFENISPDICEIISFVDTNASKITVQEKSLFKKCDSSLHETDIVIENDLGKHSSSNVIEINNSASTSISSFNPGLSRKKRKLNESVSDAGANLVDPNETLKTLPPDDGILDDSLKIVGCVLNRTKRTSLSNFLPKRKNRSFDRVVTSTSLNEAHSSSANIQDITPIPIFKRRKVMKMMRNRANLVCRRNITLGNLVKRKNTPLKKATNMDVTPFIDLGGSSLVASTGCQTDSLGIISLDSDDDKTVDSSTINNKTTLSNNNNCIEIMECRVKQSHTNLDNSDVIFVNEFSQDAAKQNDKRAEQLSLDFISLNSSKPKAFKHTHNLPGTSFWGNDILLLETPKSQINQSNRINANNISPSPCERHVLPNKSCPNSGLEIPKTRQNHNEVLGMSDLFIEDRVGNRKNKQNVKENISKTARNRKFGNNSRSSTLATSNTADTSSGTGNNIYNPNSDTVLTGLRPVIIDGSNVAMRHGFGNRFSCRGLEICIEYFLKRKHKVIAFVPTFRKSIFHCTDPNILDKYEKSGQVVLTPSRRVQGSLIVAYDDRQEMRLGVTYNSLKQLRVSLQRLYCLDQDRQGVQGSHPNPSSHKERFGGAPLRSQVVWKLGTSLIEEREVSTLGIDLREDLLQEPESDVVDGRVGAGTSEDIDSFLVLPAKLEGDTLGKQLKNIKKLQDQDPGTQHILLQLTKDNNSDTKSAERSKWSARFIVQAAHEMGGVIVSTDNYRDLLEENPAWKDTIEKRLLMFTWVDDILMFPQDPLGRNGPRLEEFLRFPS
uniref:RNase NYN domain-containing protein n=1 Tax=Timema monikensis TaxID=170555 RepID=A0A7R9E323_9NEOP|nr:unnamed protein product [Timema monikensis]